MTLLVMLIAAACLAIVFIAFPALRRRGAAGAFLWKRAIITQQEDLLLGAAWLLMAATLVAGTGELAGLVDQDPVRGRTARWVAVRPADVDDIVKHAGTVLAPLLILAAAAAVAASLRKRSAERLIVLR